MNKRIGIVVPGIILLLLLIGVVFLAGYLLGRGITKDNTDTVIFKDSYEEKAAIQIEQEAIASDSGKVITHGPRDRKKVALTFDAEMTDGMKSALLSGKLKTSYEPKIVEILRSTKTPATFFLTGMWIELFPKETYVLANDPLFELASHSYSDSSYQGYCYGLNKVPDTLAVEEIGATEKLLRKYGGIDNKLFRFPGGCYSSHALDLVNQANDIVVHWDVNGFDGFNNNTDSIIKNVVNGVKNGSIIILHLNGAPTAPKTAEALPKIIAKLKNSGFEFVKTTELLGLPPNQKVSK